MFFEKWGQWWMGATRQSLPPWIFRGAAPKRLCDDRIAAPRLRLVFHFYPGLGAPGSQRFRRCAAVCLSRLG